MFFDDWFTEKMRENGYKLTYKDAIITRVWLTYQDGYDDLSKDMFRVVYLRSEMSPEQIRMCFTANHDTHILFVVDVRAMPTYEHVSELPTWIRALHAIYYGRIYVYNDLRETISACHFDWDADTRRYSEPIDISGILFTDTDCKLRDFPGVFHIARFYDRAFWKEQEPQKPKGETWKERAKKGREEWEQATKGHAQGKSNHRNTEEDIREAFARAFREHMRSHGVNYDEPRPQYPPSGIARDKWFLQLYDTGNLADARALYKQLAKDWHPDLNPGKPQAHETMQAINIAYDKVKAILR